jgi:hypothetical protein
MKVHEKAKLYDSLITDYEELINEMRQHCESIKTIQDRKDLVEMKQNDISIYYPLLAGTYQGSNFGLDLKIGRAQSNLKWYKSIK